MLSAVALFKRMQASEEWLRRLAAAERDLLAEGTPVSRRCLRAVDATTVSEPGSTGTDWRIHYATNLTNLQCDFFELTDVRGGETWGRIPVSPGDVLLGDRSYAYRDAPSQYLWLQPWAWHEFAQRAVAPFLLMRDGSTRKAIYTRSGATDAIM
jgi:hypothetical protein